jgi:hypothetical protein
MGTAIQAHRLGACNGRLRVAAGWLSVDEPVPAEVPAIPDSDERAHWERQFGVEWVEALEGLGRWAEEQGIPLQSGSSELLASGLAQSWGWGTPPVELRESGGMLGELWKVPGAWVLRVPPGCGGLIRNSIEGSPALAPHRGTPWIQVEETPLVYLPSEGWSSRRWPAPESWYRAARLVEPGVRPRKVPVPRDFLDLVRQLGATLAPERVLLRAWDLWRAAEASQSDQGAYWLARQAAGFADVESARLWRRQAWEWGIRVLEPCSERSGVCARRERNFIRLGLEFPARAAKTSLLRAHGHRWRLRRLVARISRNLARFTELAGHALGLVPGLRSEGGNSPFPPHTVIAHNPRPAALRSKPFVTFRRTFGEG